jgi:hypothetical protein
MKIIVEFRGGSLDGKRSVGDEQSGEAAAYYWLTDHGQVGRRFHTFADYAVDALTRFDPDLTEAEDHGLYPDEYEVIERLEGDNSLYLRAVQVSFGESDG